MLSFDRLLEAIASGYLRHPERANTRTLPHTVNISEGLNVSRMPDRPTNAQKIIFGHTASPSKGVGVCRQEHLPSSVLRLAEQPWEWGSSFLPLSFVE